MFKTIIILLLLLTMFLFSVQCDRDLTDSLEYNHLFLEDLDYMQNLLEENFPFYGVVYRKNGVDIDSIFDNLRTTLYETNDMSEAEFNNLLIESFRPLVGSAHFNISCKFHEEHNNEVPPFVTSMIEQYKTDPHTLMQHISSIFGEDLADAFIIALQDENISDILELYELSFTIIESRDNLFTEIIEDQRIAYMSINSFFVSNAQMFIDEQKIHSFFEEIQNYEHLIIDLRNNGGGWFDYGLKLLLEPLANDTYYIDAFVFIKDGSYATAVAPPDTRWPFYHQGFTKIDTELYLVSEILREHDLPEMDSEDAERLSFGFRAQAKISPSQTMNNNFNNNVWILTNRNIGSAALITTWLFKETGIATLVGDTTGGNYGGARITATLPNTGIPIIFDVLYITDSNGRPLETGIIPHFFNHTGMDALETVLALIG